MTASDSLIERSGPRASVRVHLTNPESGYESETETTVSPGQWAVIDAVLCGREQPYASAPALLEALKVAFEQLDEFDTPKAFTLAKAAISKATGDA